MSKKIKVIMKIDHDDPKMVDRIMKGVKYNRLFNAMIPIPKQLTKKSEAELRSSKQNRQDIVDQLYLYNKQVTGYGNKKEFMIEEWGVDCDASCCCVMNHSKNGKYAEILFYVKGTLPIPYVVRLIDMGFDVDVSFYDDANSVECWLGQKSGSYQMKFSPYVGDDVGALSMISLQKINELKSKYAMYLERIHRIVYKRDVFTGAV